MGWMTQLHGKVVSLDTAPLIYFIEKHPVYHPRVRPFFQALQQGDFEVVTSTITIAEVLVHPFRQNNAAYMEILQNADYVRTVPFTADIAESAARLRADYRIRTPDAIQMATAIAMKAEFFLTNDFALSSIPDLRVLVMEKLTE